jgi:hypothetical protein
MPLVWLLLKAVTGPWPTDQTGRKVPIERYRLIGIVIYEGGGFTVLIFSQPGKIPQTGKIFATKARSHKGGDFFIFLRVFVPLWPETTFSHKMHII